MKGKIKLVVIEEASLRGDRRRAVLALKEVAADLDSSSRMLESLASLENRDEHAREERPDEELGDQARRLRLVAVQVIDAGAKVLELSGRVAHLANVYARHQEGAGS